MANHYSRNVPALEAGCAIRVRLVQMIAEFLAERYWRDALPTTVTFFLFASGASDPRPIIGGPVAALDPVRGASSPALSSLGIASFGSVS